MNFALLRFERGIPDSCPTCGSYKIEQRYLPERGDDNPYRAYCATCKWEQDAANQIDHTAPSAGG